MKVFSTKSLKQWFGAAPPPTEHTDPLPPSPSAAAEGVLGAAWLAPSTLLVAVRCSPGTSVTLHPPPGQGDGAPSPAMGEVALGSDNRLIVLTGAPESMGTLALKTGDGAPEDAAAAGTASDLPTFVRNHLAGLPAPVRLEVMNQLTSALAVEQEAPREVATALHRVREILRERLPYCETKRTVPQGMYIDALLAVDARSFYVKGWMWDSEARIRRITAESPEGNRVELLDRGVWCPRADILEFYKVASSDQRTPGFISYFQTKAPSLLPEGWIFELHNSRGGAWQRKAPAVTQDLLAVRNEILGDIRLRDQAAVGLLQHHIYPALTTLQERHRATIAVEALETYGKPADAAAVSLVVPLYKRIDFVEQQMAQFAHDPEIRDAELIYVLDSPELADRLRIQARQLYRLYRIPFRVVTLNRNAGFSTANNVGASIAKGRLLLLLNSDVLPDRPGWLGSLVSFHDAREGVGAVGPKLLYEDDSLQHAGMHFFRAAGEPEWENMHYFKGLHRRLPAANVARPVPAVTGACLLIDRALYQDMGGLHGRYVQGDYEDSDLCLRLIEAGYENWYAPEAELYHLEGQSYPGSLRQRAQRYNRWVHTHLWDETIERVMADAEPSGYPAT